MADPLHALLALPEDDRIKRGLLHTPLEIAQQSDYWPDSYHRVASRTGEILSFLREAGITPGAPNNARVFLIGAGTSDYVGQCLHRLISRRWNSDIRAIPSTTLLPNIEDYVSPADRSLWISFSRSGESPEAVALLGTAFAKYKSVRHILVTCNNESRMVKDFAAGQSVFAIVLNDHVNDRGLAMTSSFSNMVVAGQALANVGADDSDIPQELAVCEKAASAAMSQLAQHLAAQDFQRMIFLGTDSLHGVAQECALKVLELTAGRIQTASETYLGFRHGPMSALNEQTLFVAFLSSDRRRAFYEHDLLEELSRKNLARMRVAIVPHGETKIENFVHETIRLAWPAHLADEYRPPVDAVFGQLLGLFCSLRVGLCPDTPSPSGAISRVVSQFRVFPNEPC